MKLYADNRINMKEALANADSANNLRIKLQQVDSKRGGAPMTESTEVEIEPAPAFRINMGDKSAA